MTKRRKTHEEFRGPSHQQDDDYIPLPIQTFLWRQTSPFVRPFLGKARDLAQIEQRDACKLFERIIITNNIWGQSPSLTDAISSIDRWRLIKVSFPFVLQCTAALLNNKLIKDHNLNRLGGNEAKMMYTLQWILMNASEECADSEVEAKANATNAAIAAATAASLLKPAGGVLGLASSQQQSQPQQQQQPPQQSQLPQQNVASQGSTSSASTGQDPQQQQQKQQQQSQGQLVDGGSNRQPVESQSSVINASIMVPVAGVVAVALPSSTKTQLQTQVTLPSSSSVSPIGSSSPTKPLTPTNASNSAPSEYLLPISSIQMFVYHFAPIMDGLKHSDFLTSNQRLEMGTALWEPLFNQQLPNVQCLKAQIKPTPQALSNKTTPSAFFNAVKTITASVADNSASTNRAAIKQLASEDIIVSSALQATASKSSHSPFAHQQPSEGRRSLSHQDPQLLFSSRSTQERETVETEIARQPTESNAYATYLDVAVLRCLFISDWQESGVHWAITFLSNRMSEIGYDDAGDMTVKSKPRSKSLPDLKSHEDYLKFEEYLSGRHMKSQTFLPLNSCDGQTTTQDSNNSEQHKYISGEQAQAATSKYLRVEDAETSDSGGDGKHPVRRLSFSSGMQTLANQIRKTSKRAKKSPEQRQSGDSVTSESQLSIDQPDAASKYHSLQTRPRRSSSADDLNINQVSALTSLHKTTILAPSSSQAAKDNQVKDNKQQIESNPVITITPNAQLLQQQNFRHNQRDQINNQQHFTKLPLTSKFQGKLSKKETKQSATLEQHFPQGAGKGDIENQRHRRFLYGEHSKYSKSLRKLDSIIRSQTIPRNLHFSPFKTREDQTDQTESLGAGHYIDELGRIDPIVVLKVLHSISKRESACSQRVCDKILSLVTKLIDIGVLRGTYNFSRKSSHQKDLMNLLPTRQHEFALLHGAPESLKMECSDQALNQRQQQEEATKRRVLVHKVLIDIVFRLYHHMGCPNHCGFESTVDHHHRSHPIKNHSVSGKSSLNVNEAKIVRLKLRETLELLSNYNRRTFITYVECLVNERGLQQVIDILHSLIGFCRSDYIANLINVSQNPSNSASHSGLAHNQSVQFMPTPSASSSNYNCSEPIHARAGCSSGSPHSDLSAADGRAQGSSAGKLAAGTSNASYATTQTSKRKGELVETIIIKNCFKLLVTRMVSVNKELKLQENTSLYCDIRRLISFIRDNYNNVFRSVTLSALIDSAKIVNQQQKAIANEYNGANHKRTGDFTRPPSDDESSGMNGAGYTKRSKNAGESADGTDDATKTTDAHNQNQASVVQSHHDSPVNQRPGYGISKFHSGSGLRQEKYMTTIQAYGHQDQQQGQSSGILSLSKAKKKLEQVFGGKPSTKVKMNSGHLGEDFAPVGSIYNEHGNYSAQDEASRRTSLIILQGGGANQEAARGNQVLAALNHLPMGINNLQLMRQNQQMYACVKMGMSNFSFLMESCAPGDFLDPALLAALLDLKSPIAVRAAIFLECANFVHRCNRGQWPSWMKMNVMHRSSNTGLTQGSSSRLRKSSSIQRTVRNNTLMYRAAGRAFYSWAEAVGARLEELLQAEQETNKGDAILEDTENDDQQQTSEQGTHAASVANDFQLGSDVNLFQPMIGNTSSPFALKMAACQLLFEVTTFLRETYRYLPPSIVHHQTVNSKLGDKMTSIYDVSRAVTANRRWSMALSSLGFGQLPATLSAISAGQQTNAPASSSHLRNPTTSAISEQPERRISFILHETNDENDQSQQQQPMQQSQQHQDSSSAHTETNSIQAVTSPLAIGVNTNEQQQDAMKKMTSGLHLSQSNAPSAVVVAAATCLLRSSGAIESQTHRRKSIKLRKSGTDKESRDKKTKFAQDLDEEMENSSVSDVGIRRTDSLRSRRRVSGISEKSDTSDRAAGGSGQHASVPEGQQVGELSGDDSGGNGSCEEAYANENPEKLEADESRIMSNMPWFKAITLINLSIDCNCVHFPVCKTNCYKMHQNICRRLISCVQNIYQDMDFDENYAANLFESRLSNMINAGHHRTSGSDAKLAFLGRAGSDCSANVHNNSDGETKRKDKRSKKHHLQDDGLSQVSPRGKKHLESSTMRDACHLDSFASANGMMMVDAVKTLASLKARRAAFAHRCQDEPMIVKYVKSNVRNLLHCPMSSFLKGAVILPRDTFVDVVRFSWSLLLEDDQQLARSAAVGFIISSIKCPGEASKILLDELECSDASRKIAAIQKFHVIWDARYQCWPRLEDGAFVHFKMAPPSIEFTLPSPKIAQESKPVVDPPWMPRKTSNVEEVTIGQDQTVQKSFVTATKTRRKQQIEIVTKALREKHDKLREDRENYHITSVPITLYAAYEPTLSNQPGGDEMDANADDENQQDNRALIQMKTAQALFPTCLCQAAIVMINLLEDSRVTYEGSAVYETASKVIWSCLVEDSSLFLRYFFERLTRQNQNTIFQVLRRLIRFMPRLPPQAAYTLYNYLIGFIIYYIRCPVESSQKLISDTLSVLCLVVPSVYGLFLKDLKQILRKEQCDHNLLITANVPSAKKIIVHGSDSSGIPSQFPIDESTQYYHILVDSLEFFGIEKEKQNEYFLMDVRTNHMHNLHSYVRDYYSFKRSQHPQLQMINMDPDKAFNILQKQELINQFLEFGKVCMSLSIVKSSYMAVQRVLFLHEELMKLPTFPRKALETNFSLFRGKFGHQVFSMDRIHKICWVRVIARMFELTSGFFLQLSDILLFLNAISGIFVLHCEEASVSRLCLATFINAALQYKTIFATDGFMPIMATIVQVYSNHQSNQLLCRSIEFVCKQFYITHRKPFLLQLFGSVASRLNTAEIMHQNQVSHPLSSNQSQMGSGNASGSLILNDPNRISPIAFLRLLRSLEKSFKDPLDILELVDAEKPLRAVDFCYQQDKEAIEILDIISLCVTVTAYASESPRSTQMLIILESVVPLYMKHLQASTSKKAGQSMGKQAHKEELQKIQSISICIRTLIVNCEGLTRNFNGPLPSIDFRSSSIRRTGPTGNKSTSSQQKAQANSAGSPMDLNDEPSFGPMDRGGKREPGGSSKQGPAPSSRSAKAFNTEESEITRGEFIVPRDTLLNLVAEFLSLSTARLVESAKKYVDLHQKHSSYELLDVKSHLRLAEVANSLLKFASTDPSVMACRGLIRYMNEILPNTEWRQEAIRPALIMILKRLDKTFNRIAKKTWVKRSTDWEGAKQLLKGAYLTFIKHPYIVHLPHLKSLISCCQNIILNDGLQASQLSTTNLMHGFGAGPNVTPGPGTASTSGGAFQQQPSQQQQPQQLHQPSERQQSSLLSVTSIHPTPGVSSSPSGAGGLSGPTSSGQMKLPSLSAVTAAATLADRLAYNSSSNSAASQGFNSVTIRLIAMQLLQTGENQTLENLVGNFMSTPEKLESLMLNLIYPMCIRVCSGAREAPKLRICDIMFMLNIVLNLLAPQSASSKSFSNAANSPKATTDTSQFILSKITTTIGSTQTGATALGIVGSSSHASSSAHQISQHQEGLKIGFLGLKILCVCFETQLASEWIRISRVIRDLAMQSGQPSGPLWDFLDFVATYRFPMFILLLPTMKCHLAKKVRAEKSADNMGNFIHCQRLIDAKIQGIAPTVCRSKSFLFVSLTAELRMLKEQLIAKRHLMLEGERQASSHAAQSQGYLGGQSSMSPNQMGQSGDVQPGEHFTAYHRLSAAIAMFANQGTQAKMSAGASGNQPLGAALKGTCFAAQLGTSTPIGPQIGSEDSSGGRGVGDTRCEPCQSSIRLSTAKSREEARKVMNTILRRTSYPHNQPLTAASAAGSDQASYSSAVERKSSHPQSPTATSSKHQSNLDLESGKSSNQIIMDPAMLMAAFPAPRKPNTEGSGILKQLIQTIDRQNSQRQQQYQTTTLSMPQTAETKRQNIYQLQPTADNRSGTSEGSHNPDLDESHHASTDASSTTSTFTHNVGHTGCKPSDSRSSKR